MKTEGLHFSLNIDQEHLILIIVIILSFIVFKKKRKLIIKCIKFLKPMILGVLIKYFLGRLF